MKKSEQKAACLEIRSAYSYREPVDMPVSGEPSRTKQEFKTEVNINTIISKMRNGISPPAWMTSATPRYGDFTNLPVSFQEAHAIMAQGEAAFASLPLDFRRALDHDPRNLDHAPRELYERFGLLKKPVDPTSAVPEGDTASQSVDPALKGFKKPKKIEGQSPESAD